MASNSDYNDHLHQGAHTARQLREQANAIRESLKTPGGDEKSRMLQLQGANSLDLTADRIDNPKSTEDAILKLDIYTHEDDIKKARLLQAVSVGGKVYLPFCTPSERVLPHCFVRSALFPASEKEILKENTPTSRLTAENSSSNTDEEKKPTTELHSITVASSKSQRITLTLKGSRLLSYDRAIFSACLSMYSNQPLASGPDSPWIEISFGALAKLSGTTRGSSSYESMKASLHRLSTTTLTIGQSTGKSRISLNPLLEIKSELGEQSNTQKIKFKISQEIAELFGRQSWWRFPKDVLKKQGLEGWIASYFASHKKPKELPLSYLYRLSGLHCKESDFKKLLTNALEKLKSVETPNQARILNYKLSPHSTHGYMMAIITTATMKISTTEV